jgi:hypothetical protein
MLCRMQRVAKGSKNRLNRLDRFCRTCLNFGDMFFTTRPMNREIITSIPAIIPAIIKLCCTVASTLRLPIIFGNKGAAQQAKGKNYPEDASI